MSLKLNFELMAEYNKEMNGSVYRAASTLSSFELMEDRGAFFGSVIATLNHILVGDIIWLKRFSDHPLEFNSLRYVRGLQTPRALNTTLYDDLGNLLAARNKLDDTIIEFAIELTEDILLSSLAYKNTKGDSRHQNLGYLIQHFFNHQTHHRGQVSTLLSQAGADIGVTDLLICIPNEL